MNKKNWINTVDVDISKSQSNIAHSFKSLKTHTLSYWNADSSESVRVQTGSVVLALCYRSIIKFKKHTFLAKWVWFNCFSVQIICCQNVITKGSEEGFIALSCVSKRRKENSGFIHPGRGYAQACAAPRLRHTAHLNISVFLGTLLSVRVANWH